MEIPISHNLPKYVCIKCNYKTDNKKDYGKHLVTTKHKKTDAGNMSENKEIPKVSTEFRCTKCSKLYNTNSGLWKHKQVCIINCNEDKYDTSTNTNSNENNDLIKILIKENSDFKNIILELVKNNENIQKQVLEICKHNSTNITCNNTNSHNKTFNLHFFLNETCKDAMNIMDFVESIKLQLSDLEKIGEIGYVDGISNIIVKNLKALDVTQRPLHCTDKKREVLYLKDEDKWEKQGEDNIKLRKVIRKVTSKNIGLISQYKEKHPDCSQSDSRYSDEYSNILIESMGGSGDNYTEKEAKIIQNISKEVVVDK